VREFLESIKGKLKGFIGEVSPYDAYDDITLVVLGRE